MPDPVLEAQLRALREQGLYRTRRTLDGPQGPEVILDGRRVLNFCSNDYLGLAGDARVADALREGAGRYGTGSGASPMVCGRSAAHAELEDRVAAITGRERALIFSSGYLANLALAGALMPERTGRAFLDRRNHASLIDAARLAGARLKRYRDPAHLRRLLGAAGAQKSVLTDGVFSMDGDLAPLPELARICAEAGARLMVDDAHGFGVLGETGGGTLEHFGLAPAQAPVLMATFGKAVGTAGAFIAASDAIIDTLVQRGRTYIYSTAPPPAVAHATLAALEILAGEPDRRRTLSGNIARFRRGAAARSLGVMPSETPIQPLVLGAPEAATAASEALLARGVLVTAIRPPTVPAGTSRLRITLSAAHGAEQIDTLLDALAACAAEHKP